MYTGFVSAPQWLSLAMLSVISNGNFELKDAGYVQELVSIVNTNKPIVVSVNYGGELGAVGIATSGFNYPQYFIEFLLPSSKTFIAARCSPDEDRETISLIRGVL